MVTGDGVFPLIRWTKRKDYTSVALWWGHFGVIEASNAEKALETVSGKTVMATKADKWVCVGANYQIYHDIYYLIRPAQPQLLISF